MEISDCLASVEVALVDGYATLSTRLGDHEEVTVARLWRGQVLVDWEPDPQAGDCLLRPALLRRLMALHGDVRWLGDGLSLAASGRVVAAISPEHSDLVRRLGGPHAVGLAARLRFADNVYCGGEETYYIQESGRRVPLVRLRADVRVSAAPPTSPHRLRAPM